MFNKQQMLDVLFMQMHAELNRICRVCYGGNLLQTLKLWCVGAAVTLPFQTAWTKATVWLWLRLPMCLLFHPGAVYVIFSVCQ